MKRILSISILCILTTMSFAQKKVVKEAKKALDSEKFSDAKTIIKPALTDPETANDQDTWKLLGDIDFKMFDKEKDNETLSNSGLDKRTPNFATMYSSLYEFLDPYLIADSLGQLPDEKGKVKNKVRKDIVARIKKSHPDYYNGGAYYNEQKDHGKAADYFARYAWDIPALAILDGENAINTNDSTFMIIKYYAAISAIQAKDKDKAIAFLTRIKNEQYIENQAFKESDIYELLSSEYQQNGDTTGYIKALEDGASKFPQSKYFIPNLINEYIKKKQFDEATNYLDRAIANAPDNSCELYSVKASIFGEMTKYDDAIANYEKALAVDANCERALEGAAVIYMIKAQDLKDEATKAPSRKEQTEIDNKAVEYYKKAYPLLEKYKQTLELRNADKYDVKQALYKLRNVYYNLGMDKEYEDAEKAYDAM